MARFATWVIVCSAAAFAAPATIRAVASQAQSVLSGEPCLIKGNISINSGARIYHVPGQHFYNQTKIRPEFGERWFCTEAEARAAGWRKARR
ncbi:MAG: hypothetical protein KUA43_06290 [Hoeflea sp.]|uniref:sunset domain-containing protein n=1 Tax=Hoeflea sp. TaxID=1940281 RepID=UPI001E0AB944|nr:hypothetical protein [Hoeflea sp.]MBU4530183.1 hypothetical protein [Alphaproteobacteria bacterium]MBU4542532.1 hypothetical protein [Alphaproteobacteria bacterium]MBU4551213.1 hypothetical protein [Alphaproteobacteria bacterium]MBV1723036.1 hypothetical protein [Hoeflea sp.]MBV1760047.1 hypothetical protein [Hoeflea sp.]